MAVKYCPECGAEYQEWAKTCLDCGAALVTSKPDLNAQPEKEPEVIIRGGQKYVKEPLVAIGAFTTQLEAQISKGILQSEGIESMITSNQSLIAYQPDTSSVGSIQLIVKESEAEKAMEILDSIEKDIPEGEILDDEIIDTEFQAEDYPDKTIL